MPKDQEQLLAAWCERGDVDARQRLIEQHLPLVRVLARRFVRHGEQLDDLVQIGAVGLIKAVDRYDPARGSSLAAYAVPTIVGEIRRHLRDSTHPLRVPRARREDGPVRSVPLDLEAEAARDTAAERRLELGEERVLIERGPPHARAARAPHRRPALLRRAEPAPDRRRARPLAGSRLPAAPAVARQAPGGNRPDVRAVQALNPAS